MNLMSEIPKSKCSICDFIFNSSARIPKVLPCGHTFCDKCIYAEFKKNQSLICKKCDKKIYTHYSEFIKNEYILSLRYKRIYPNDLCSMSLDYKNDLMEDKQISCYFINNKFVDLIHPEIKEKIKGDNKHQKKSSNSFIKNNSQNITNDSTLNSTLKKNNSKYSINNPKKKKIEYFIKPSNQEFSQLFNYFEFMKNLIKFHEKFRSNGKIFKIIKFVYQPMMIFLLLILNYYLLNNFEFGLFYMFISIFYVNENNLYDIVLKLKMYIAYVFFILFEDLVSKIGLLYVINISVFNNILVGFRTIYVILILGNEFTLNPIVSKILWMMCLGNLLLK